MIKSLVTMFIAIALLFCAITAEQKTVNQSFEEFKKIIYVTQKKLESENPTPNDADGLRDFWLEQKRKLHAWIPHSEIKEIDLWVSECSAYTKIGKFDEACTKLEVLKTLSVQTPFNFLLLIENLF